LICVKKGLLFDLIVSGKRKLFSYALIGTMYWRCIGVSEYTQRILNFGTWKILATCSAP